MRDVWWCCWCGAEGLELVWIDDPRSDLDGFWRGADGTVACGFSRSGYHDGVDEATIVALVMAGLVE